MDKPVSHVMVYLAAGSSRRFGANKLLWQVDGKPMYRHGLDRLAEIVKCHREYGLAVVTRYPQIEAYVSGLGHERILPVFGEESEKGIAYSIRAGIRAARACWPFDYISFIVADQPGLKEQTMEGFFQAAIASGRPAAAVCRGKQTGNPALFSAALVPELLALAGDTGGKAVLKNHWEQCFFYPVEDGQELEDIDFAPPEKAEDGQPSE